MVAGALFGGEGVLPDGGGVLLGGGGDLQRLVTLFLAVVVIQISLIN